ncbi:MAG: Na/Pi cotransporter family protein [Bacteroidetes bacterium]|nr:MAG: Na/Pi cotransporter family protein [Bacteroidota bacterium]
MNFSFIQFLTLFGALSLFLFGMKVMSEGIQKLAGDKMRSILSAMTSNRFLGVLTGFFITTLVQSSSASTVMVVSFVNAGLMSLVQSVGVIMGANIGTTTTAWLISFLGFKLNISSLSLPIIGIAFPLLYFTRDRLTSLGETLLGFALLFMGLGLLQQSVPDLHTNPEMFRALQNLTDYGFGSVLIFLGIGTLLTIVLQSSSATMALTLVMCNNGWIGFEHGAAIVLGENIGTTITANLAALVGNVYAKRTALAHTLFNIFGVIWMLIVFKLFIHQIDKQMVNMGLNSPMTDASMVPFGLAIFHTVFNITNTLLLIGFIKYIVYSVEKVIPSKGKVDERHHLEYFGSGILHMAEFSVLQAKRETRRYCDMAQRMFNFIPEMVYQTDRKKFAKLLARVSKYEEITDRVEVEITTFLIKTSRKQLSTSASEQLRRMRLVCSEVEKIGDVCFKMATMLDNKKEEKAYFTPRQREELDKMFALVNEAFDVMMVNLERGEAFAGTNMQRAYTLEKKINQFRDYINEEIIDEIEKGSSHVKSGFYFNKMISSCEKVGDSILNINEAAAGVNIE